jgi:hypothetical protein
MMKVLEDAIEKVKRLPKDRQAYVAEVLEQIAAAGTDLFRVPEEHRAAVRSACPLRHRSYLLIHRATQ